MSKQRWANHIALLLGSLVTLNAAPIQAEVINRGIESGPYQEARPAPDFLQPDVKIVVGQPSPSEVNPSFLGPVLLMKSAQVDLVKGTAKLPLHKGKLASGETAWFIITDATDENLSNLHGVNYSPKLAYGFTGRNQRTATISKDGTWVFNRGKVDFKPKLSITPGAANAPFPPQAAQPGSVGDNNYTPLVKVTNATKDVLFNAPMVAFNQTEDQLNAFCNGKPNHDLVHDKVVAICPREGTVTLELTIGFTFSKPILYLSTEANDSVVATLETATYAPAMEDLPFAHEDALPGESAERIYVFVNGATGLDNPHRQGLYSALTDRRGPLNVLGGIPTINLDYSPMWRIFPAVWTEEAIKKGYRARMSDAIHIEDMGAKGYIRSLDGGSLRAVGFIVNCPVVYRVN
ncbi:hypothetical protein [Leptolyngbya sp. GGD]|uniref:hypothetical protein n=1 Tax=Leptolyngbya sp. GGD TaxID=2997907 RepID=UPI00227C98F2|nr:hypothetical protein [Leptolyngbya sp. GGD]MCY6493479.1 hypothetical protein [Leptolyngbya sp. GGD]